MRCASRLLVRARTVSGRACAAYESNPLEASRSCESSRNRPCLARDIVLRTADGRLEVGIGLGGSIRRVAIDEVPLAVRRRIEADDGGVGRDAVGDRRLTDGQKDALGFAPVTSPRLPP